MKNIVVFSDGCIDRTEINCRKILLGSNHYIITANNKHEISNYRMGIPIAQNLGCKYICLLQDDDIYHNSIETWIRGAIDAFEKDPNLAIIGGNSGGDPYGKLKNSDINITTSKFERFDVDGKMHYKLGDYYSAIDRTRESKMNREGRYVGFVNRAPQIMRISFLNSVKTFHEELEPFQFDDYVHCATAWRNGWKVLLRPTPNVTRDVGIGGMRLINSVGTESRPEHFIKNWDFIVKTIGDYWNSGDFSKAIKAAQPENSKKQ